MKKKLLSALIVAAAALAGWHYYTQNDEIQLSDLALENVEALAQNESGLIQCAQYCLFDYNYECHVYGYYPNPMYCFYSRPKM